MSMVCYRSHSIYFIQHYVFKILQWCHVSSVCTFPFYCLSPSDGHTGYCHLPATTINAAVNILAYVPF